MTDIEVVAPMGVGGACNRIGVCSRASKPELLIWQSCRKPLLQVGSGNWVEFTVTEWLIELLAGGFGLVAGAAERDEAGVDLKGLCVMFD